MPEPSDSVHEPRPTPSAPGAGGRGRRPYSRIDHRSRSHDAAHADSADALDLPDAPSEGAGHPLVASGPADLIATPAALESLLEHLRASGSFAYDSEFIGELTYHPKLCLVQAASRERVALIDPLADLDLTAFWELLCDPAVEKIVHAGQQDIEPVVRHLGRGPVNVFDTQIAAGLAGLPYPVSLSKLVAELAGAKLGKGLTFTHWDQRPLSAMQLRYAADDVRYLPRIRAELGRRLDALGHADWAREECAAQCEPALYGFNPLTYYLRVRGAGSLPPRGLAVLRALTVWRDGAARRHDVPPRSMLKDEILVELARNPVKAPAAFSRIRGLPRPIQSAHGDTIIETTLRALELPATDLPAVHEIEPTPSEKFRGESLWCAAQCLCAAQGIDPALAGSRHDFANLYSHMRHLDTTAPDGSDAPRLLRGWRRDAVGQPVLDLVFGRRNFGFGWSAAGGLRLSPPGAAEGECKPST